MLEEYPGLPPITEDEKATLKKPILKAMARLKIGKTVQDRQKIIQKSMAYLGEDDVRWHETLASRLSEEGVESGPAQTLALIAAAELREDDVAKAMLEVNASQNDPLIGRVIGGLIAAAPEMEKRIASGHINSDEIFIRVGLTYMFRREPESVFQMFTVDAASRALEKVWDGGVQEFTKWSTNRPELIPVPEGAVGYMVVLGRIHMKGGYYLYPATDTSRHLLKKMKESYRQMMGEGDPEAEIHAAISAAFQSLYLKNDVGNFAGIMSAISEETGRPHLLVYARDEDVGIHTSLRDIPASSVEEARRAASKMMEVTMHDDFRKMQEFLSQMEDAASVSMSS